MQREHEGETLWEGSLKIEITFFMNFPASCKHKYKVGQYCKTKPDLDNLVKFLLDTATGILWKDDAIICAINSRKIYDSKGATTFIISELK